MTRRHVENKVTKNVENEKNGKKCAGNKKNKSEIKKKKKTMHTQRLRLRIGKEKSLNGTWIKRQHRQLLPLRLYRISAPYTCVRVCVCEYVFSIEHNQIVALGTLMSLFHMSPRCVCVCVWRP